MSSIGIDLVIKQSPATMCLGPCGPDCFKKYRSDTDPEFDFPTLTMEPEVTMKDLMDQLNLTAKIANLDAKKSDLLKLQTTVTSHSIEIKQLRDDLQSQAQRIQELETTLGQHASIALDRTRPDVYTFRQPQNGGAQSATSDINMRPRTWCFKVCHSSQTVKP